jgi:hypothetical protein
MSWMSTSDLRRAGLAPYSWGVLNGLGKFKGGMPADPGKVSAAAQAVEVAYTQLRSFGDQIASLQAEIATVAASVGDTGVKALADDAQLIGTSAGQKLMRAKAVYAMDQGWVEQALGQNVHAGWGFGRDVVLGQSTGDPAKNTSRRPLDGWNRLMILEAAATELAAIQSGLARDLGTIRTARQDAVAQAQGWRQQAQAAEVKTQAVQQQSLFEQNLLDEARRREQEKLLRVQQLEQQRAAQQDAIEQQRAAFEQARLQRGQELEIQREQMAQQLEAAKMAAEQSRLQAQLQAEAQRSALEQARLQQQIQMEAGQQQQSFALEQQRQQALYEAEARQYAPQGQQPQAYYATAGGYGPGYAPVTGAFPSMDQPPPWAQYEQAGAWGESRGAEPEFDPFSGGFSGLGAITKATTSTGTTIYRPQPSMAAQAGSALLTALPGLVTSGGTAAANVLRARKGLPPLSDEQIPGAAELPQRGGGGGLGLGLAAAAIGLGLLVLVGRGGGKRSRGRR